MLKRKNNITLNAVLRPPMVWKGLAFIIIVVAQTFSQPFTKEEKEILELTDTRNSSKINITFDNINKKTQPITYSKQFLAIINLADTSFVDSLLYHYNNSSLDNKSDILRLLGYLNSNGSREFLLTELYKGNDTTLRLTAISLGQIGLEENLNDIFKTGFIKDSLCCSGFSLLYQFAKRRITNDAVFQFIKSLKMPVLIEAGFGYDVSYILNRTGNRNNLAGLQNEITLLTNSQPTNPCRMWSFSALGKLQDTADVKMMLASLTAEKDWRVRVNIVNALGNYKIDNTSPLLGETAYILLELAMRDESVHVSIVALQALGKLFAGADTRDLLVWAIQQEIQFVLTPGKAIDWQIKAEAIRTYAKIFKDESKVDLLSLFSQTDNYDIKAAVVGSFAFMDDAMVYKELRDSISADIMRYNAVHPNKDGSMIGSPDLAKVYKAFVDALAELDNRLDAENKNIIRLIFSEFASSKHPAIVDVCLTNLQDSMYLQYRGETCQIMMFDYESFAYPKDKDVTIMYIQAWDAMKYSGVKELLTKNLKHKDYDIAKVSADALKNITGKDYEKEITSPKYRTDFDWNFIDKLGEKKIAAIKTNRGYIKIELFPNIAPFTVQNFVKLGEKGYYNNTTFHRVVPNFVIQGGDPTGTGYGGPGYSIRSEFSPLPYDAYTVGMASSGKDTEGSQFFITHSPQPHLDGKYTLFGKVIKGFDVVDKIQIGDVIETVTFSGE
jgi:cyclophilin family peptidyl-prolyl cis-trans isomerase